MLYYITINTLNIFIHVDFQYPYSARTGLQRRDSHRIADGLGPVMTAFSIRNLTISHSGHPAVHHLQGEFKAGQFTAIVGPNGGGKSSLLNALAGIHTSFEGNIESPSGRTIAHLPQLCELNMDFPCTVGELVAMGLWKQISWFHTLRNTHKSSIQNALSRVGLHGFDQRLLSELSAGQLQRALFARLIVQNAEVLLLDEPFNAMDRNTQHDLAQLLEQWRQEGRTVIAVLHDHALVHDHFEQTLLLARSAIAWGSTSQVLKAEHLFKARQMAQAWEPHAPVCKQNKFLATGSQ